MTTSARYDHVVAGAGASGMTAALLLAGMGRKVLLVEAAPDIGGSMVRFRRDGVPFDTGFHFTGGFEQNGLLCDMLRVLGLRDAIRPQHYMNDESNRFVFESTGESFCFPPTRDRLQARLKADFPEEAEAVETYFAKIDAVRDRTANMDLRRIGESPEPLEEDFVSLRDMLDALTGNERLKTLLAAYGMCYGVAPGEVSFATHARICQGLYEEMVRVERGGEAFVEAYRDALASAGVEVRCACRIEKCEEVEGHLVGAFRLSDGSRATFDSAVLTMHPKTILDLLPKEYLRNAFVHRVSEFEPSIGFFAVFAVCEDDAIDDCMTTLFPDADLDRLYESGGRDLDSALFFVSGMETCDDGVRRRTLTALETSHPADLAEWADSSLGRRPPAYGRYKAERTRRIMERIERRFPSLRGRYEVLTSSSVLSFRDHLHSPDGSAYGVKQRIGQFNLFGKLPLRNLYVAGQSSLLPGIMGAMMSAFIVVRALVDKEAFSSFVQNKLAEGKTR